MDGQIRGMMKSIGQDQKGIGDARKEDQLEDKK